MSWFPGMPLSNLLVDFDGTIADSDELLIGAMYDHIGEVLNTMGFSHEMSRSEYTRANPGRVFGDLLREALFRCRVELSKIHFDREEKLIDLNLTEIYRSKVKALPFVEDALREFRSRNLDVSVVSSTEMNRLIFGITVLGFRNLVGRLFSAVSSLHPPKPKPAPDIYFLALREKRAHIDSVLAIEDSPHGVSAAVGAGITTIGYVGGVNSLLRSNRAIELQQCGALLIAHSWPEVIGFISEQYAFDSDL